MLKSVSYRVHYPGTFSTESAVETGKQLWASEDYSTFNDNTGGGCWARVRLYITLVTLDQAVFLLHESFLN